MPSPADNRASRSAAVAAAIAACLAVPAHPATPASCAARPRAGWRKTVCASERLSDLDLELATVYARLLRVTAGATQKQLTAEQHRFWAARGDCRGKTDPPGCLDALYSARIAALRERPDYTEQRPVQIELPPERLAAVGEGWSRSLGKYRKAIHACLRRTPLPAQAVLVAWPDEQRESAVGVRMQGPNGEAWMCVAAASGLEVFTLREANQYETLPDPGPLYYPDSSAPPSGACGNPIQILDENDAPAGWLGPSCGPKVARPVAPEPDPEAAREVH